MTKTLASLLDRYLALRRSLGFQTGGQERLLTDFISYVDQQHHAGPLRAQLAFEWAFGPTGRGCAKRLNVVRGFLAHVRAAFPETEIPPHGLLPAEPRPRPHLYSDEEIAALILAALSLGPRNGLRPHTYATLIGLLVSSGLRIGEAAGLRRADVDLEALIPCLHVRRAKFRKSRLVALHPTTAEALRAYGRRRDRLGYGTRCDAFFVSEARNPLGPGRARCTFVTLARRAGVRGPSGPGPRLHDFRHTFAVRRLLLWCRAGDDVRARLPELSVYLGHVRPQDTYWYLTATPELLAFAAASFEPHAYPEDAP